MSFPKDGSMQVGKTPCVYCGRPSEAFNRKNEPVCMHHYLVTDHGAAPLNKTAGQVKSRDGHILDLTMAHKPRS